MIDLPNSDTLPIEKLSSSFDHLNSYKFFWFLAILEHVREKQSRTISVDSLLSRMVAGVWYPTNYFRLSFGKQDRLGQLALQISESMNLPADTKRQDVVLALEECFIQNLSISRDIKACVNTSLLDFYGRSFYRSCGVSRTRRDLILELKEWLS